jgi:cyclopropane-fatty-acyl-phospholipid synthase
MNNKIINELAKHSIHRYGSIESLQFEKHMERYFAREYDRWHGNTELPEKYGVSSFEGNIVNQGTHKESIEHYDKEFKIYQSFLDKKYMVYTMAYYGATEYLPQVNNELTLDQAQIDKYNLIIQRAGIKNGDKILELGCGFGGFTTYLQEKFPNVHITAINPSRVQTEYLNENLAQRNAAFDIDRFELIPKFFDDITQHDIADNSFDIVISIGVLEAVSNLDKLFEFIARILKPGGKTFHHFIVSRDTIPQFLKAEDTLMADYFPGGHIWPYAEPMRHDKHLKPVSSWFVNGLNYWKTLDEWHKRFWNSIDELYPEYLTLEEVEDWNKYFTLCKTMFIPNQGRSYGNGHYLFEKPLDSAEGNSDPGANKPNLSKVE